VLINGMGESKNLYMNISTTGRDFSRFENEDTIKWENQNNRE
jgi:hypothetical protein